LLVLDPESREFISWLTRKGCRKPTASVLHNTWSPTAAQYKGRDTIVAIERFHMQSRGFSTIAANAYSCPDGKVITGRALSYSNWAHALVSRSNPERGAAEISHGDDQWFNSHAFGLETVANFDRESPVGSGRAARSFETTLRVLTVVHRLFAIPASRLFFHRDVADKTCPGLLLDRAQVRAELARRLGMVPRVFLGRDEIDCSPEMVGDRMTVQAAPLLITLKIPVKSAAGVVHANGRAFVGELRPLLQTEGWRVEYRGTASGGEMQIEREVRL
jgi:hypothetical protein